MRPTSCYLPKMCRKYNCSHELKGTKEDGRYIRRKAENGVVFGKCSLKIV